MIRYLVGDATDPAEAAAPRVIAHVCNDAGAWGRGFVLAVSKRWPHARDRYRAWFKAGVADGAGRFELGAIQVVAVAHDLSVVNMIGQHGYGMRHGVPPIRYDALGECLLRVAALAPGSVHMPRIGCGLAGGRWHDVLPIVERSLRGTPVFVYDLSTP